jgi:hypothetical protein
MHSLMYKLFEGEYMLSKLLITFKYLIIYILNQGFDF